MTVTISTTKPEIDDIYKRFDTLAPVARKVAVLLGIADPELRRFWEAPLASAILGERLAYQLPPEQAENSFKFYPMIGYVTRLVLDEYQKLSADDAAFTTALHDFNLEATITDRDEAALKLALRTIFSNKVLVGPTTGSFGIGLLKMAEALRGLTLEGKYVFDAEHTVTAVPLFPPDPTAEMPPEKWEIIQRLHAEQNADPRAQTLGEEPPHYDDRKTRDADALRLLITTFQGNGFYTPTNPLSIDQVAELALIVVGNTTNLSALTNEQLQLLEDFFITVDEKANTLTITRHFGGGVAGSAQSLTDAQEYFKESTVHIVATFPTSAGPGAGGVALSDFTAEITPDPDNPHWAKFLAQPRYYLNPSVQEDGKTKVPPANGMGSTINEQNIVAELAANKKGGVLLTETTDVLRRIARALLHSDLTASAVLAGQDVVPYPELAAATPLAGQLEKKLREAATQPGGVQAFAERLAGVLTAYGLTAEDFWRYASRGAPHQESSWENIVEELQKLAVIQGERSDGGENFLPLFIKTLAESIPVNRAEHKIENNLLAILSEPQDPGNVTILQITGLNAEEDPHHAALRNTLEQRAAQLELMTQNFTSWHARDMSR
ncbi:MAG: hypothetical protein ACK5O1_05935 [Holosporales bacterium]|jgi:hypothetical protein